MMFSQNALLLVALLLVARPASLGVVAQRHIDLAQRKNLEKSKVPPLVRRRNDAPSDNDRRRRRALDLSTAVNFPNPCLALPADRVPDFDATNPANNGWSLVDFCLEGASPPFCHFADDAASSEMLAFKIDYYGQTYNKTFINTNGYLEFDGFYLDAFYADADLRGDGTGNAGYVWRNAIGTNKFAVAWDHIGYHNRHTDKVNTFQVVISDGTDESMGLGNNVCLCYADMQWTTGDSFGGVGGFGGYPANVGGYKEDEYYAIGTFDQPGTAYDGAYSNNEGVDYLDYKSFCFQTKCQANRAEIWNPTTNAFVEDLVDGNTYCLREYNLRAVPCPQTAEFVVMKLWNTDTDAIVKSRKERASPYFLWGNIVNATGYSDVNPNPKNLTNGNYAIRITATNPNSYAEVRFTQSCP